MAHDRRRAGEIGYGAKAAGPHGAPFQGLAFVNLLNRQQRPVIFLDPVDGQVAGKVLDVADLDRATGGGLGASDIRQDRRRRDDRRTAGHEGPPRHTRRKTFGRHAI